MDKVPYLIDNDQRIFDILSLFNSRSSYFLRFLNILFLFSQLNFAFIHVTYSNISITRHGIFLTNVLQDTSDQSKM